MTRRLEDLGELSPAEPAMAAAQIPDRIAIAEADYNYWARLADDHFCQCCGARSAIGRYCRTCEAAR